MTAPSRFCDPLGVHRLGIVAASTMAYFIVVLERGPAWQWTLPMRRQAEWESHARFMDALTNAHSILAGGPIGNEDTAVRVLLIVEAENSRRVAASLQMWPGSTCGRLE